jgi:beta-lactamase class A
MHLLRRSFAAVLLAVTFLTAARADAATTPAPLAELQAQLAAMMLHAPGHVAVTIEDLTTGLSTSVNGNAQMPAASTIKIPVMVEVFRQLAAGDFDLNRAVTLEAADRDWGWGDLADAAIGSRYSVQRLLTLMIDDSDNTATNMLIRLVGRTNVNHTMTGLGLTQTALHDYIRSDGPIRYALRSSPRDMAHLLDAMAHHTLVDEWSSREMIAILCGQTHNGLIPAPLPAGTTIAHKTGTLHDTLDDVGIVFLNNEPYVIAVMATDLPTLDAGYRFIHGISRVAYDAFTRFAGWRAANGGGTTVLDAPVAQAPVPPVAPDQQMWTPANPEPALAGTAAPADAR